MRDHLQKAEGDESKRKHKTSSKIEVLSSKTKFCEIASILEADNVKNEAVLRDFL